MKELAGMRERPEMIRLHTQIFWTFLLVAIGGLNAVPVGSCEVINGEMCIESS